MRKSKFIALMLVAVLSIMSLAACSKPAEQPAAGGTPAPAEKITWKLGHLGNEEHIWNKTALKFAELVAEKTNGQIEIKVYPNESLGKEVENIDMIKTGAADMVISGESMQTWAPKAALMAVPYAFRDTAHMQAVIESDLGDEIAAQIEEKVGLIPLYYHLRAPRNLTSNRAINTPADLNGFKMRVPNVPLFVDAWKAAGAAPQAMAFNEVFTALQQGVIEGQENPVDLIYSAGFYEVQKFVNVTEHVNGWIYVLVGVNQFNKLSDDLKAAVLEAAEEAQAYGDSLFAEQTADFVQKLEEKGMTFNRNVDKAAFQAAMEPAVLDKLTDEQKDLYQRIVEFK